jgi:hypothetical protein
MTRRRKTRRRGSYKLIVKRLPRKVCVSIRAARGRTLAKRKYVHRHKKGRRVGRRRKTKYQTFIKRCMKKNHRHRGSKLAMCARRYKRGLAP